MKHLLKEISSNKKKLTVFLLTLITTFTLIFLGYNFYCQSKIPYETIPEKKQLKFGLITDVHCFGEEFKKLGGWSLSWKCKEPMLAFIDQMNNNFNPDFVIELGDFIDGRDKNSLEMFRKTRKKYQQIKAPKYHVLGNHEVDNFTKPEWLKATENKSTYYYFDQNNYRMIVLDGNYREKNDKVINVDPKKSYYPGIVSPEQIKWLKKILKKSKRYKKFVFIHQPPIDESATRERKKLLKNAKELQNIFSEYRVIAVFSGHIEELCALEKNEVKYYILQGFHKGNKRLPEEQRFKNSGAFYEITTNGVDLEIKMHYKKSRRSPYQSLLVTPEKSVCPK